VCQSAVNFDRIFSFGRKITLSLFYI
ncbi:General stress protein A, partial [Haemophilus influenzae]